MNKKVVFLPYDMDTAIGINNEGALVFSYNVEYGDMDGDRMAYNDQVVLDQATNTRVHSVLWTNLRDMFGDEIKAMYAELRASGALSYEQVENMFEAHQSKWPEAIFNEDAYFKYIQPLIDDNDNSYLEMLLGSKAEQRKWWLYNRFKYIDSKYNCGDAQTDRIQLRGYAISNITLTPYADIYATIKWGSTVRSVRATRNTAYVMPCPLDGVNDTEIYIYSASQLSSLGDLSGLKVGFADVHFATKLRELILGNADANYTNTNLKNVNVGNLKLLRKIDVRNCTRLGSFDVQQIVDLSGCSNIEEVYFDGTAVKGVSLPNGGFLKKLHLPGTITVLSIRNQTGITEFVCPDFSNVVSLYLENSLSQAQITAIAGDIPLGCRVRLFNYYWEFASIAAVHTFLDLFEGMSGMDQNGNNTEKPQIYATVHVPTATGDQIDSVTARYPDITVDADTATYTLRYYDAEGETLLHTETVQKNQNGTWANQPAKAADAQYTYSFLGWSTSRDSTTAEADALTNITNNRNVYAAYSHTIRTYTVTFVKAAIDGGQTLQTIQNVPYGTTPEYTGATPTSSNNDGGIYTFEGWTPAVGPISGNTTYTAVFHDSSITVTYMNGSTQYYVEHVASGSNAHGPQTNPTREQTVSTVYSFAGWNSDPEATTPESGVLNNITANKTVYAMFTETTRTYTITFQKASEDGGGTITTMQVAYGTVPVYSGATPTSTRAGYQFVGWTPSLTAVTGAATYTARFISDTSMTRALIKRTITEAEHSEITTIGNYAFYSCSALTTASFPSVTNIGNSAFYSCSALTTVSFPSVTSIGNAAFYNCSALTTVSFPSVTSIGNAAFNGCRSLTTVSFPVATSIGSNAFQYCSSLTTASFPAVTSIGNAAFCSCSALTTVSFPAAKSIGNNAFQYCSSLTTASFPAVTSIGSSVFQYCSALTTVVLGNESSIATAGTDIFFNANNVITYVPDALVSGYKAAANWSQYASRIKGISELPN